MKQVGLRDPELFSGVPLTRSVLLRIPNVGHLCIEHCVVVTPEVIRVELHAQSCSTTFL